MNEEEITYRIRKYYLAKKFGTLDKEYPVVGKVKDLDKVLDKVLDLI